MVSKKPQKLEDMSIKTSMRRLDTHSPHSWPSVLSVLWVNTQTLAVLRQCLDSVRCLGLRGHGMHSGVIIMPFLQCCRRPAFLHSSARAPLLFFSDSDLFTACPWGTPQWAEAASYMAHFPFEAHTPRNLFMRELGLMNWTSLQVGAILFSILTQIPWWWCHFLSLFYPQ